MLDGVSWLIASVILHFCHSDPYPIIDFRSLWSVSLEVPSSMVLSCSGVMQISVEKLPKRTTWTCELWTEHYGNIQRRINN